ncbi:MAG: hypothetical protein ACFFBP_16080 [Promethearchaeota archaeon]
MGETVSKSKLELTAPKIIALISILIVFREGIAFFWAGYGLSGTNPAQAAALIGIGLLEALVMAGILLIALLATIVDIKIQILKKLYNGIILLIVGILVLIIELWGSSFILIDPRINLTGSTVLQGALQSGVLLGSMLVIAAALCEILAKKKEVSASLIVVIMAIIWLFIDSVVLFISVGNLLPTEPLITNYIYYGVLGIIIVIYLIFIMQNKLNVKYIKLPYDWWMLLILGFIAFIWIHPFGVAIPIGGTLLMIGFILKVQE